MTDYLEDIKTAIIDGAHKEIESLVHEAVGARVDPDDIVNAAMIPGMDVVGRKFSQSEIFVPEMLASAVTMNRGLDIIKPKLQQNGSGAKGKIVMCTVKGDLHDIGKNLVNMMLEGAGFEVVDLGVDMSVDNVVEKVKELKPDILGLSALLTTTMSEMPKVIEALEAEGMRNELKVVIGGAPVDAAYGEKIGADGYGRDAAHAVEIARSLIS